MPARYRLTGGVLAIIGLIVGSVLVLPAAAINYGSGLYGGCQYDSCSITISSGGSLNLNVTPATDGACTSNNDSVSVLTDDPNGYSLTLAGTTASTALASGSNTIASSNATQSNPAGLAANTWGYRVDGVGGFGAGPTSAQNNVGLNSTAYAGVPGSGAAPSTLANTSAAADPAVSTKVWYGVCVNTAAASGTYTAQVTYSAITND